MNAHTRDCNDTGDGDDCPACQEEKRIASEAYARGVSDGFAAGVEASAKVADARAMDAIEPREMEACRHIAAAIRSLSPPGREG